MDAVIQLLRNALCCVKDLHLFPGTFIYDPSLVSSSFPAPLNKTTPLEICICVLQLYACLSCISSGINLVTNHGLYKLWQIERIASTRTKSKEPHQQLVNMSLNAEAVVAAKTTGVGYCTFIIGVAFFWLFANSLHITETGWIGGLPFLIHALTAMEIALLPLLYLMLTDGYNALRKASIMQNLAKSISTKSTIDEKLTLELFCLLQTARGNPWIPFWTKYDRLNSDEKKMLQKEIESVQILLKDYESEGVKKILKETSINLEKEAKIQLAMGYRSFLYFILNFIAFYGYLLGIIVYYLNGAISKPAYASMLLLGLTEADADWLGNFVGDLMWTIEPILIITTPYLFRMWVGQAKKEKKD
jgi:hypothetical protein